MSPTVSVTTALLFSGKNTFRVVGSRVANTWSFARTSDFVSSFSKELFPVLVYPIKAKLGIWLRRRCARC